MSWQSGTWPTRNVAAQGWEKSTFCRNRATGWKEAPRGKREQEWFGEGIEGGKRVGALGPRTLTPFIGMLCLYVCHSSHSCVLFFPFPLHLTTLWFLSTPQSSTLTPPTAPCCSSSACLTGAASAPLATSPSECLCLVLSSLSSGCSLLVPFSRASPLPARLTPSEVVFFRGRLFRGLLCTEH